MKYTHWMLAALIGFCVASCSSEDSTGSDERFSILQDDFNRFVYVHVPDGYDESSDWPLLVVFHGSGDSGLAFQQHSGLDKEADKSGFLVAYPSARGENWAEGCDCVRADLDGIDDLDFVDDLITKMSEDYQVDESRVFAVGYSQGGLFTQRLACERSDVFAGIGTISGMMSKPISESCQPEFAPDILLVHGDSDEVLPIEGFPSGSYATLSVYETMLFWREANNCPVGLTRETIRGGDLDRDVRQILGCDSGSKVRMEELIDGRHRWPDFLPGFMVEYFNLGR